MNTRTSTITGIITRITRLPLSLNSYGKRMFVLVHAVAVATARGVFSLI